MGTIFGYCRISTRTQNIERQIRNIKAIYPTAIIVEETFTGTKFQGRKELDKILKKVKEGDLIIFDSASRMGRCSDEAMDLYEHLFNSNVDLEFIKEPYINTSIYREQINKQIEINLNTGNEATDTFIQAMLDALNKYTIAIAREQIKTVFDQAEKEVKDLHQRVKEGIETARLNNVQIGGVKGSKYNVKKSEPKKELIKKYSICFNGTLNDTECMKLIEISRNTFYKYKKELQEMEV